MQKSWSHLLLIIVPLWTLLLQTGSTASSKPNIVILFGDDVGYGDLEVYGHPTSSTPNLNKLAAEGLRFTQFYVTSPVCSPSRSDDIIVTSHVSCQGNVLGTFCLTVCLAE